MPDRLTGSLADLPRSKTCTDRTDTQLAIDPPWLRKPLVRRVIENGDVCQVVTSLDLHANVDPGIAPAFGLCVAAARCVDDIAGDSLPERHTQEETAIVVLAHGDFGLSRPLPAEIEMILAVACSHLPGLAFGQDGSPPSIEQVVDRSPPDRSALAFEYGHRLPLPVAPCGMMEVVATVDAGEPPVKPGLVLVMAGAVLGENALAIRSNDRVDVRAEVRPCVLRENRCSLPGANDRDGALVVIEIDAKPGRGNRIGNRFRLGFGLPRRGAWLERYCRNERRNPVSNYRCRFGSRAAPSYPHDQQQW